MHTGRKGKTTITQDRKGLGTKGGKGQQRRHEIKTNKECYGWAESRKSSFRKNGKKKRAGKKRIREKPKGKCAIQFSRIVKPLRKEV